MENFNRQARNILAKNVKKYLSKGLSLHASSSMFAMELYKLDNSDDQFQKIFTKYLLCVMYLDSYKVMSYKQKECTLENGEADFFGILCDINDIDDCISEVAEDPLFLSKLITCCYTFEEITGLGKVNLIKSLSDTENEWLNDKFSMHQQDLESYDINVNMDNIVKNIKAQINHQNGVEFIDFKYGIIMSIAGFIRNLFKIDYENALTLLSEVAKTDYLGSKYLTCKTNNNDTFINHIDLYENYSIDDIIYRLVHDQEFLINAVWMIADVYVFEEYNGIKISKEDIGNIDNSEIAKKLILK